MSHHQVADVCWRPWRRRAGSTGIGSGADEEGWHFYYQAMDGQWVFLHPLNVRCLLACYGAHGGPLETLKS